MTKNSLRRIIEDTLDDLHIDQEDAMEAADTIVEICDERGLFGRADEEDPELDYA